MTAPTPLPSWLPDYDALTLHAGFVLLCRSQIEVSGKDRASYLHNLCTNEIKKLPVGAGCEAFFTTVQGKTVGHGFIFAEPDRLIIDTEGGQAETLLKHLDHYLVCEQVVLTNRTNDWSELFLAGPDAETHLSRLWGVQVAPARLAYTVVDEQPPIRVSRVDLTSSPGFLLTVERNQFERLKSILVAAGVRHCAAEVMEAARIEHGTPRFGIDISDKNLPQELSRDDQAISFVKGCYLGQETVARIDALGHVNKSLVGVQFSTATVPDPGSELRVSDQVVGQVTSATFSPRLATALGLAFVRQGHNRVGTCLATATGEAQVVKLPLG